MVSISSRRACAQNSIWTPACAWDCCPLAGRRAWIEAQRRNVDTAVKAMRLVLADNAGYAWGWYYLSRWLAQQKDFAGAQQAIEQWLKVEPQNIDAQRQLASLYLEQKKSAEATNVLQLILRDSPTSQFAGETLIELQLTDGDLSGASGTLQLLQRHQPGARTTAWETVLLCRQKHKPEALEALKRLCLQPAADAWALETAVTAMRNARWLQEVLKTANEAVSLENCNPNVGRIVMQEVLRAGRLGSGVKLLRKIRARETRIRAAVVLANEIGKRGNAGALSMIIREHQYLLRDSDAAWTEIGFALTSVKQWRKAADWLADWRDRREVGPAVYFNLCLSLRNIGRYAGAENVARQASCDARLAQWTGADVRLFLAIERALDGRIEEASAWLKKVHIRDGVRYDVQMRAMATAIITMESAATGTEPETFKRLQAELAPRFSHRAMWGAAPDLRRTLGRTGKRCIWLGAGWRARLWFLRQAVPRILPWINGPVFVLYILGVVIVGSAVAVAVAVLGAASVMPPAAALAVVVTLSLRIIWIWQRRR